MPAIVRMMNTGLSLKMCIRDSGYTSPNTAYFAFVEFDGKKGQRVKQILEIPVYVANRIPQDKNILIEYFESVKGLKNVKILREKIKKNALISVDGFPMRIRGVNEKNILFKGNVQLVLDREYEEIIRNIEKYNEKAEKFSINEKYDGLSHDSVNGLDVYKRQVQHISMVI